MSTPSIKQILENDTDPGIRMVTSTGDQETNRIFSFSDLSPPLDMDLLRGVKEGLGMRRPNMFGSVYMALAMTEPTLDLVCQTLPTEDKFTYYVLNMLARVKMDVKSPQALCLVEHLEDRERVVREVRNMGRFMGIEPYVALNQNTVDYAFSQLVIGTPSHVFEHSRKKIDVSKIRVLVVDECVSQVDQVKSIINKIMNNRLQILIFVSCLNDRTKLLMKILPEESRFNRMYVNEEEFAIDNCKLLKIILPMTYAKKNQISKILDNVEKMNQIIIFVSPESLQEVCEKVMSRRPTLQRGSGVEDFVQFMKGKSKIFVTSSRGIDWRFDQSKVTMVINVDLPMKTDGRLDVEEFYKRISRAGRLGPNGIVLTLVQGTKAKELISNFERILSRQMMEIKGDCGDEDIREAFRKAGY